MQPAAPGLPETPRAAATVVLLRDSTAGPEVLLLRRNAQASNMAGVYVFPGGKLDADDATRMTEGLMPEEVLAALKPEAVVPAMLVLAHESAPTRTILCAGAGTFEAAHITLTQGIHLGLGADVPEQLAARLAEVTDRTGEQIPQSGAAQGTNEVGKALAARV